MTPAELLEQLSIAERELDAATSSQLAAYGYTAGLYGGNNPVAELEAMRTAEHKRAAAISAAAARVSAAAARTLAGTLPYSPVRVARGPGG
jgi:hypothetical protein